MILNIKKDNWLTDQIGKPVYHLISNELNRNSFLREWESFKDGCLEKDYFVFSKVNTDRVEMWQCLENAGFRLIDTNVQFENNGDLIGENTWNKGVKVGFAEKKHKKAAGLIARNNFVYSRFHLDPKIDDKLANLLKQNWVENFFHGKRGDKMVIASLNDEPVGFLQLIINNEDLIIDLIGVDKKVQGLGVASAMIQFTHQNVEYCQIKVGTQIGNLPSIRLYHKLGFKIASSDYVFHYHSS